MRSLPLLILPLTFTTLSTALKVRINRFAEDRCVKSSHIRSTTDISTRHTLPGEWEAACHTFEPKDPLFKSFSYTLVEMTEDADTMNCSIVAFAEKKCQGRGRSNGGES